MLFPRRCPFKPYELLSSEQSTPDKHLADGRITFSSELLPVLPEWSGFLTIHNSGSIGKKINQTFGIVIFLLPPKFLEFPERMRFQLSSPTPSLQQQTGIFSRWVKCFVLRMEWASESFVTYAAHSTAPGTLQLLLSCCILWKRQTSLLQELKANYA